MFRRKQIQIKGDILKFCPCPKNIDNLYREFLWHSHRWKYIFNSYEIFFSLVLGGWGNSRAVIRKRIKNYPIKELEKSPVIDTLRPLKAVIEISKGENN